MYTPLRGCETQNQEMNFNKTPLQIKKEKM